jgi:signal transduction histidine kinase
MVARGKIRGAIGFVSSLEGRHYSADDLLLAEELGNRAAIAIDNADLFESARAARGRAEEANRVKMEFLAAMSHELRTPLNAMTGYAELLEMNLYGSLTEAQREVLGRMRRSQRNLQGLIEDVLGFAKLEAGRLRFDIRATRVDETLSRMGDLIAAQCLAKNIQYEYHACGEEVCVEADRERLEQIVLNLLGNAVKFTPDGGRVTLGAVADDDNVTISVADTGIGIPAEKLEAVFEPFVQLSTNRVTGQTGTGLGLAISRDLARAMRGNVAAASIVGGGSTFSLTLPRAAVLRAPAGVQQRSEFSNEDAPSAV